MFFLIHAKLYVLIYDDTHIHVKKDMKEKKRYFKDKKIKGVPAGVKEEKSTPEVIRVKTPSRLASSTWIRILMPDSSCNHI